MNVIYISCALLCLSLLGCSTPKGASNKHTPSAQENEDDGDPDVPFPPRHPPVGNENLGERLDYGVGYRMVEKAFDGDHEIAPGASVKVDAHSTLVLSFDKPPMPESVLNGDPEWHRLNLLLEWLRDRSTDYFELAAREVDLSNVQEVERLQEDVEKLAKAAAALSKDPSLGLEQDKLLEIVLDPAYSNAYQALAAWVDTQLIQLRVATERRLTDQVQTVTVQATRDSITGQRSALHIDEWDTLEQGVYDPIDRTGLRQNEGEAKRIAEREKEAEATVKVVRTLQDEEKLNALKAAIKSKLKQTEQAFKSVLDHFKNASSGWEETEFNSLTTKLADLAATHSDQMVKGAAARLSENLTALKSNVEAITRLLATARSVEVIFEAFERLSYLELLSSFTADVDSTIADILTLADALNHVPNRLSSITMDLGLIGQALTPAEKAALLPEPLRQFLSSLPELPLEAKALAAIWNVAKASVTPLKVAGELQDPEDYLIAYPMNDLVDARLNLKYGGLALRDLVSVRVRVSRTEGANQPPKLVDSQVFQGEVGFIGLHGKPTVHAFFGRALSGNEEATKWKPNVAAGVEWHYTVRNPDTSWEKAWNWLDPGAGIHLANLDMGEDSFEVGAGGTVSIWDGLLAGGFGFNFSESTEYIFVGVNLISALKQGKKGFAR